MKNQKKKSTSFNDSTQVIGEHAGKIPPQAVDMEASVIGTLLLFRESLERVIPILEQTMFYKEAHGIIYDAIVSLYNRREPVDLLTVTQELRKNGTLELIGGTSCLTQLTNTILHDLNVETHAAIVFDKYIQREIIRISADTMEKSFSDAYDIDDLFSEMERRMSAIGEMIAGKKRSRDLREILDDCLKEAWKRHENYKKGKENGIRTGFCDLDRIMNGWQNSDFIVLAARPSMGKTAVALKFVRSAAEVGVPVALFSLEMKDTQLVHRMILSKITVNPQNYQSGNTSEEDMQRVEESAGKIYHLPINIDHSAGVNMSYIRSQSKILKKQGKCGLIVIDYLQLIREENNSDRNREQAMAAISNQCKSIAKELDVPVIALSQLNRECEKRGDKKPTLADLRDSGAIEQDADVVIFVHRPNKFGVEVNDSNGNVIENYGELIVSKHRNGNLGVVKFTHNGSMTEFFDYDVHRYSKYGLYDESDVF